jgi:hypothetical protein
MKTSNWKKECPAEVVLTSKLDDKIIKMLSKSHETIPLKWWIDAQPGAAH